MSKAIISPEEVISFFRAPEGENPLLAHQAVPKVGVGAPRPVTEKNTAMVIIAPPAAPPRPARARTPRCDAAALDARGIRDRRQGRPDRRSRLDFCAPAASHRLSRADHRALRRLPGASACQKTELCSDVAPPSSSSLVSQVAAPPGDERACTEPARARSRAATTLNCRPGAAAGQHTTTASSTRHTRTDACALSLQGRLADRSAAPQS